MNLHVQSVGSRRELKEFIELPYRLRLGDPQFVPVLRTDVRKLLDRERHPFWRAARHELFLARRARETIGRIAAISAPTPEHMRGGHAGFFGFLECADDQQACEELLRAVETWHHAGGTREVRGPVSPSTNYECGFLVQGFDQPPSLLMPCNPPYLPKLVEGCGYRKEMDLLAYLLTRESLTRVADMKGMKEKLLERSSARIRPLDMRHFDAELERLRVIYNDAWSENWGFVPMGRDEFRAEGENLKLLAEPGFVMLAELEGEPIAFIAAFRDITPALKSMRGRLWSPGLLKLLWLSRHAKHLRVAIAGVMRKHRRSGIMVLLYLSVIEAGLPRGIVSAELSWVLETNTLMRRMAESLGATVSRVFRMYQKVID